MSTHVHGPKRWFEVRSTLRDAVSLDFDWVAGIIHVALRQLQMARRWSRQAEIALAFDDLTEGHYGSRLLPFIEQAQEKMVASKWADGEPLAQVKRRVADLARDESVCTQAMDKVRRAIHALKTPSVEGPEGGAEAALEEAQEFCRECATLCRARRETTMLIESLASLGTLALAGAKVSRASDAWHACLDVIFNTQDSCKHWQPFFQASAVAVTQKVGMRECGRAIALLGCLTRHTTPHRLEKRLQHALFAARLCDSAASTSIVHPSRLVDWAGYRLAELPAGLFSAQLMEDLGLLDGLNAVATTLVSYEMPLLALPVLAILKHLATDVSRDAAHSAGADALLINALSQLGQLGHATNLVASTLAGADLPRDELELPKVAPSADSEAAPPLTAPTPSPPFFVHLPPESEENAPAVRALIAAKPAAHLEGLCGPHVMRMLDLSRAALLLKMTERVPPSAIPAIAAEAAGAADGGADAAAAAPPAKGKADPKKGAVVEEAPGAGVGAAEILRAVEALLTVTDSEEPQEDGGDGDAPPPVVSKSDRSATFTLTCETALLRSVLAQRRGMLSDAVAPLRDAMGGAFPFLPWAQLDTVEDGTSVATLMSALQPGALHWLRMRAALASLSLQQGQLDAADEQIDVGRTEANRAHDKRVLRTLLLVHARVRAERGQLPAAAQEFKLWLEDAATAVAADGVAVAIASMQYAGTLLALSTGVGAVGGAGSKIVALLRSAEAALRVEAEASSMLSTEKWPCLVQPTPGGQGEASPVHVASLQNLYLRPLHGFIESKLKLAIGLQLTSSTTGMAANAAVDAAAQLLSDAAALAQRTLHPRPGLIARVHHELGRMLRRQALRAGAGMWGGAASTGAAYADPAEDAPPVLAVPPVVEQASEALRRALTALADGEQVELGLQAQIGLELVMLHGARLVPEQDA